ncbi:MAG: DUF4838 domain-containing protein [Armatimonadetes bacterium]|nr:DUF4838 domain-containing protein [Armatimonadota bacterium]
MMRVAWLAGLAVLVAAGQASARPLTPERMAGWSIVCGPSASPAERHAAEEFQTHFRGLAGLTLPIRAEAKTRAVFIGPDAVAAAGIAPEAGAMGDEELRITVRADVIGIDGGRPRGTLYGVYEFLEELCGARFITFDHTYYPPDGRARVLPPGTRRFKPAFDFRWSYYGETSRRPEFAARLRTNTVSDDPALGGRTGYRLVMHNAANLVPPSVYGAAHPEYFALVGGERKLGPEGGGPQLCLTNPAVLDIVTQAVRAEIRRNPTARNINIAQMDNGNYCTCPACAELDRREGSHAGAMLAFVNAVAERIEKEYPDVLLSTFAYWYTRKPPRTLRARRNVLIQLCSIECCDLHAIDDPSCALNRTFCHDMAVWKTRCDQLLIWHYNTNFSCYMLPFPNLKGIGRSVAFFARNNGRGVFMQAAGNGFSTEMSDLRNYVMSRCLWKPGRDSWMESEEFCRLHYAEAAGPILMYLRGYHRSVEAAGVHPTCFATESALGVTPETARAAFGAFREALRLARSDAVRARVEKASLCAYRAALSASSTRLSVQDGVCRPDLSGFEPNLLDRYAELAIRYGVTMESEMTPAAAYVETLRRLFRGLPAITLEDDTWRVVVLPESNGKVVEMRHKPSGRNVIQQHRAFNRFRYEDWVRSGPGPGANSILAYRVISARSDRLEMALTASDGAEFTRTVSLAGGAVRFDASVTAAGARPLDLWLHPEYDAATTSGDPRTLGIYVKAPGWVQANRGWRDGKPASGHADVVAAGAPGGAFAYYNHVERFGVEQSYDPAQIGGLGLYWEPSRLQVNLEMTPRATALRGGETVRYGYEVRYLAEPPVR